MTSSLEGGAHGHVTYTSHPTARGQGVLLWEGGLRTQSANVCKVSAFHTPQPGPVTRCPRQGEPRWGVGGTQIPSPGSPTRRRKQLLTTWEPVLANSYQSSCLGSEDGGPELPGAAGNPVRTQGKDTSDTDTSEDQKRRTKKPVRAGKPRGSCSWATGFSFN